MYKVIIVVCSLLRVPNSMDCEPSNADRMSVPMQCSTPESCGQTGMVEALSMVPIFGDQYVKTIMIRPKDVRK